MRAVLLAVALLALLAGMPLLASGAEPTVTPTTLETSANVGRATIEVSGRPGRFSQMSGYSIRRATLYDRNGHLVGRSYLICFTVSRYERGCFGTYTFPRGVMTVAGPVQSDGYVLAVTGGTGFYDNARGAVKVQPSGPQASHRVFFQLVG